MKQIKDTIGDDKNDEMMEKFSKGEFTLRDMYEQFQNIMRMGPLSQVLSMIPGLPQGAAGQTPEQQKAGSQRLKNFCTMMDSMTDAELDSEKTLDLQNDMEARYRVMRIARGSGRHPQEVLQLLDEHKRFSKMVGKMGKLGKGKGANWEQEQMKRNPKQMMQQLQVFLAHLCRRDSVARQCLLFIKRNERSNPCG